MENEVKQLENLLKERDDEIQRKNESLETASQELQKYAEIDSQVISVVEEAKKVAVSRARILLEQVVPTLTDKLDMEEDWAQEVLDKISDSIMHADQSTFFLDSLLTLHRNDQSGSVDVVEVVQQALHLMS